MRFRPTGSATALERLDDVERAHVRRLLDDCEWRIDGKADAAEKLGLHPDSLRSRMQELGISRPARPA